MSQKTHIIAGGTGLIGRELINRWLKRDIPVLLVTRSPQRARSLFPKTVTIISWDELNKTHLQSADCIINLSGESIGHKAWTNKQKQKIISSRIDSTTKIATLCAELGENSPRLFNASAIGIYGLHQGDEFKLGRAFSESTQIEPNDDFLSEVAIRWENATQIATEAKVKVVLLRFGIVLAHQGGALNELKRMVNSYFACPIGTGVQPFSWIHLADACSAIDTLILHPEIEGPVNIVAPESTSQGQFIQMLCETLHKPYWPRALWKNAMDYMLHLTLGYAKADALLFYGQNVKPHILQKMHFDYTYPQLKAALRQIYR